MGKVFTFTILIKYFVRVRDLIRIVWSFMVFELYLLR